MNELLNSAAASLRKAAINEGAKDYILHNEVLFKTLKKAANRYIGGEDLKETITKVLLQNKEGYRCGIEFMGENTLTTVEATHATNEFLRVCTSIKVDGLNAALSLDLSHIGLSISETFCMENLQVICQAAAEQNIEVTISAEGADKTDAVLKTYLQASKIFTNLSITLQAYLHRTQDDFQEVIKRTGRVRLVKGAFETPTKLSIPRGAALNERYLDYLDKLFSIGQKCAIATHDLYIQQQAERLIILHQANKQQYEFESLYGIQSDQLAALKQQGHPVKMYFVYGHQWYLYLCNRIAEYPLNLFTALNDIVNG
ncbi:MAG TPA: proline dehydrogenase family protein [Pedobacter sp.]|nr:proline dehydrogenase family protein [Pedobacter sp.]